MEEMMNAIQVFDKHHGKNNEKPRTNRETSETSINTLTRKPINKCKCKISVPKCSTWCVLYPKYTKKQGNMPQGSYHFSVLWPKTCFQMMPLQAFLQHMQRLYIQFAFYFCWSLFMFFWTSVRMWQPLHSPHVVSLTQCFFDPCVYVLDPLNSYLFWSLKKLFWCLSLFLVSLEYAITTYTWKETTLFRTKSNYGSNATTLEKQKRRLARNLFCSKHASVALKAGHLSDLISPSVAFQFLQLATLFRTERLIADTSYSSYVSCTMWSNYWFVKRS